MARRRGVLATMVQLQREAERDRERRARAAAKSQRDAARAAASQAREHQQDVKARERLYAAARTQEAADETADIEQQVETLTSVLAATLRVDDHLDLESLKRPPAYPAFDQRTVGAPPSPPRESDFAVEAPSTLRRVFGSSKHAARSEQRQGEYQQAVGRYEQAARQYSERVATARTSHAADIARREARHREHVEGVTALQRGLAARQPDAVVRYLDLVLEAAEYPDGFPHSWRLSYASTSGHLAIDYELPQIGVVPTQKAYKYVKTSDTITATDRPQAQVRSMFADIIRQTALRVVHEVLEAERGGVVRTVVFNGHVTDVDPATGRQVRPCLVALATSRERFLSIDLARVETVACLTHLEARVSKDPSKLLAVEPVVLSGSLEADYTLSTEDEVEPDPLPSAAAVVPATPTPAHNQNLVAGQNVLVTVARVQIDLQADRTDLAVLLVGPSGRVDRDEDFIFYNNPRSMDGAVTLNGTGVSVATDLLSPSCDRVVLVVSASSGDSIADATTALHQIGSDTDFVFRPVDSTQVSALVWGELYRRHGGWRLRAVGHGWSDGLAGLARDYGVDVD